MKGIIGFIATFAAVVTLGVSLALSAPAAKDAPCIVGDVEISINSPTVTLADSGEPSGRKVYWLVFTDQATENQANKFQTGDRVKVRGKVGVGGQFRYVLVASIEKDE